MFVGVKVVHISTYAHGGAAIACQRICDALQELRVDAKILVAARHQTPPRGGPVAKGKWAYWRDKFNFALERLLILPYLKDRKNLFVFSPANTGMDVRQNPDIATADVLHIHWYNHGFLALEDFNALLGMGKPVVWTLHDMWGFTGGCHVAYDCDHFMQSCGNCPYLRLPSPTDLSNQVWNKKAAILKHHDIEVVTVSHWLGNMARTSSLLGKKTITPIHNPLDVTVFKPADKWQARKKLGMEADKFYLLFAAANIKEERKGLRYMKEAIDLLCQTNEHFRQHAAVLLVGKSSDNTAFDFPLPVVSLGMVNGEKEMAEAYNAADAFIMPSLQEPLGQTGMESMACGVPVVGFAVGGIPEFIDHLENGYLANGRSAEDLAAGMLWAINLGERYVEISQKAQQKASSLFNPNAIAQRYLAVYQKAIAKAAL